MKLKCDESRSNFAFNVNLRRYNEAIAYLKSTTTINVTNGDALAVSFNGEALDVVGQCRLPVSKPVLKAPMVSALET